MKDAKFEQAGEETQQPTQDNVKLSSISLTEVPTQMGLAFKVQDKIMDLNEYLVWLGNKIVLLEKGISYLVKT